MNLILEMKRKILLISNSNKNLKIILFFYLDHNTNYIQIQSTKENKSKNNFETHNRTVQSIQNQKNNLSTSYTREKSYDISTKTRQDLKKSFNTKLSKNVKVRIRISHYTLK